MNGLCLTVDTDGWDRSGVPERIRLQASLTEAVETACRRSGFALGTPYHRYSAGGMYLILPDGRNPAAGGPTLIRELTTALARANRLTAGAARVRVLLAITTGLVLPPGIAGRAVAEGLRLVSSEAVRTALRVRPAADLAVIVSDAFYRDVVDRRRLPLRSEDCRPVRLGRHLPSTAWLHVPGGPGRRPSPAPPCGDAPGALTGELTADARRLLGEGASAQARRLLEGALRRTYDPDGTYAEETLLLLGDCHERLGDAEAAAQTWLLLLGRHPLSPAACHRLGRLELQRGRVDLAAIYLSEGLRVVRAHPERVAAPGPAACALLMDLSRLEEVRENRVAANERLNEAAEADPLSPHPLISLTYRAARDGQADAARRLFATALARIPAADREHFVREQSETAATRRGGDLIVTVLLENGLDPAVSHRTPAAVPPSTASSEESPHVSPTVAESLLPRPPSRADPG